LLFSNDKYIWCIKMQVWQLSVVPLNKTFRLFSLTQNGYHTKCAAAMIYMYTMGHKNVALYF